MRGCGTITSAVRHRGRNLGGLATEEPFMEATGGFEPPNRGFADLRLSPLGYVAPE